MIHCHTPIGATVTRLASQKAESGEQNIIHSYGFHFSRSTIKNWLLYYPVEKWLSRYTDCLITINEEDYNIAISKKFKAKEIKMVHGGMI